MKKKNKIKNKYFYNFLECIYKCVNYSSLDCFTTLLFNCRIYSCLLLHLCVLIMLKRCRLSAHSIASPICQTSGSRVQSAPRTPPAKQGKQPEVVVVILKLLSYRDFTGVASWGIDRLIDWLKHLFWIEAWQGAEGPGRLRTPDSGVTVIRTNPSAKGISSPGPSSQGAWAPGGKGTGPPAVTAAN